ncbi:MAG TPA: hypothetical protein VF380_04650 [Solirubrobacteraceae bacterium]
MEPAEPSEIERPRSLAQIIGEALDIYQRFPLLFLTLALGVIAPYELIVLAATGAGPLASTAHQNVGVTYLVLLIRTALVGPLISALHMHAVLLIGERATPRLGQVALRGLRVLPVVAAAAIIAALGIGLGFLALIVPGVILLLRWVVVAQVAAVENEGWQPALARSRELTRGHYRHIAALIVVTGLLAVGVEGGVRVIPLGATSGVASVALGIAARTVTASFSALTLALLYFDLRARHSPAAPREQPQLRDLD